jgi:pyruvate dehydrogenase E2 component (dihydrolipoamide acetyltransferase)
MAAEVFMPKMSDHMEAGEIVEWLVQEGTSVEKGQPILAIMTDKATVDLEAPASGILKGIRAGVAAGAVVPVGETVAFIATAQENVPTLPPIGPQVSGAKGGPTVAEDPQRQGEAVLRQGETFQRNVSTGVPPKQGEIRATPVVRKMARELGVDIALVRGTGPEGRITEKDVQNYVNAAKAPAQPEAEGANISPIARRMADELKVDVTRVKGTGPRGQVTKEDVRLYADSLAPGTLQSEAETFRWNVSTGDGWLDLNPIQKLTGQKMVESVTTAPHFQLATAVDMTNALQLREAWMETVVGEAGERLSVTGVLVKIAAVALHEFPRANASFQDGRIRLNSSVNIGVAVGTEQGLVVPVIRDANNKTLVQITKELKALQEKAAAMRFSPEDLAGGTFTISNLGMYGVDQFNAIINPGQSAILAVGRIIKTPVGMPDDSIALRPMMNVTLSIDHRSMDGVQGAQFLALFKNKLTNPYLLIK